VLCEVLVLASLGATPEDGFGLVCPVLLGGALCVGEEL